MLVVFLGDSITQGLGVSRSGKTYANLLQKKLQSLSSQPIEIMNFGASAMQVHETRMKYENKLLELQPDIIVFAHGITESIVREHKHYLRFMPKRWRKPGWMDPRPYYSTRRSRRWLEMLESGIRWRVKVALIKAFGGKPWMRIDDFKLHTTGFILNMLNRNKHTKIIFLAPGDIDEKYFPGSSASMREYRLVLEDIYEDSRSTKRVFMCDSSRQLHQWSDYFKDRFHPNEKGHEKIAEALMQTIVQYSLLGYNQVLREVSR
ncbi:SGNH/GDSL hydrolase family protein [Paenibacillus lautus]|uniref:SGNH/GDSL hydrolase family protein n=1 Tax=Paenibacillus lautus TaxID=1401 RepID=UPI002DBFE44E|nr:SGNH/GDSL hydrolase family protein [Paenibacillus lautus]MEC0254452.1 SGNH/GDSL hydrolase family protein [Paenibacillus lautus]